MASKKRGGSEGLSFDWVLAPLDMASGLWTALKTDRWVRIFAGLLIVAAVMRLWPPDWYGQRQFHPDERWLFQKTAELSYPDEPGRASGDPAGLQYGSLPLYVLATIKDAARMVNPRMDLWAFLVPAGRALSGIFDTLSVLMVFLLGSRLWNRKVGLLAAAFLAFTPLHIQLAHFFTVDPLLSLLCLATLLACARVMQQGGWTWSALCGVFFGAALASKSAAMPLVLPILLAHGFAYADTARRRRPDVLYGLGISAAASLLAFFACMPWAVLDMSKFIRNQMEQQNILVKGSPEGTPFVRQYWDTLPVFFHLKNILLYYQGPLLGGLGLAALLWQTVVLGRSVAGAAAGAAPRPKSRPAFSRPYALLLSWMIPYLLVVGFSFAKFARYMLPLTPFLCLVAAASGLQALDAFKARRRLALAGLGLVLASALALGTGYFATYLRPHPWIAASRWIFEHVPLRQADGRQTSILNESWGDDLPVEVDGRNAGQYHNWQINIVEWDSPTKLQELGNKLSQSDLLVLADPRAYGTYLRQPRRFPLTYAYYHLLFTRPEALGFKRALDQRNQPGFLGWRVDDSRTLDKPLALWADESFTLYDHPRTLLFEKIQALSAQQIEDALTLHVREMGLGDSWQRALPPDENLRLSRAGGPAAGAVESVNPNYGLSRGALRPLGFSVLTWWVLMILLGLCAAPLCASVFGSFRDKGYAMAKATGLLLFTWLAFWLVSVRVMFFHQGALWAVLLLCLAALGAWLHARRSTLAAWWAGQSREILWAEGVFAAAFLFYCAVRAFNPNIHDIAGQGYNGGGEPLGMTYLSSVTRCATFPAYNPWLALSSASYYYFGYVIAGTLTKLSGFPPAITYNLSLALFFALAVLTAYGVGVGLTARRRFALLSAAAVACFGSLWTVPFLINRAMAFGQGIFSFIGQIFGQMFTWSFMWDPTRFPELVNGHIFEFPYFSYLYADLHPHNMVIPFFLVLVGLLLAPFKSPKAGLAAFGGRRGIVIYGFLLALFMDVQYCINTWNWPMALALGMVSLPLAAWAGRPAKRREKFLSFGLGLGLWGAAALLGILLIWPFWSNFQSGHIDRNWVQASEWQMGSYIPVAFFAFGMAGLLSLAPLRVREWAWGHQRLLNLKRVARLRMERRVPKLAELLWAKLPLRAGLLGAFCLLAVLFKLLAVFGLAKGGVFWLATGSALFCLAGLALFLDTKQRSGEEAFAWILGLAAMGAVAGSELVYVGDRMNTIFKFWIQAWVLMGLVFGYGAYRAFEWLEARARKDKPALRRTWNLRVAGMAAAFIAGLFLMAAFDYYGWGGFGLGLRYTFSFLWLTGCFYLAWAGWVYPSVWTRSAWAGVLAGLAVLGMIYPLGATVARIDACSQFKNPHLDGLSFMDSENVRSMAGDNFDYDRHDAGAIRWLNEHADKTETVLEAPGRELYKGFSRYSIFTGLPTLVGWKYQVGQQLGPESGGMIENRDADAGILYTTTDANLARGLMEKYKVRWVVVGPIENKVYGGSAAGLAKFAGFCKVAYQNEGVTLYEYGN